MPDFADLSPLALVVVILFMGERWANKLVDRLSEHLDRQQDTLRECSESLLIIKESLQNLDKE